MSHLNFYRINSFRLRYAGSGGKVQMWKGGLDGNGLLVKEENLPASPSDSVFVTSASINFSDPGGTDVYYFRFVNNGQNGLKRLNWIEFEGLGVSISMMNRSCLKASHTLLSDGKSIPILPAKSSGLTCVAKGEMSSFNSLTCMEKCLPRRQHSWKRRRYGERLRAAWPFRRPVFCANQKGRFCRVWEGFCEAIGESVFPNYVVFKLIWL
ncbi:MAG: hypothetical protein R3B47_19875 [Bacteroidia bacterium]